MRTISDNAKFGLLAAVFAFGAIVIVFNVGRAVALGSASCSVEAQPWAK